MLISLKGKQCIYTIGPPGPNAPPPVSSPAPSGDQANQPPTSAGGNKPGGEDKLPDDMKSSHGHAP